MTMAAGAGTDPQYGVTPQGFVVKPFATIVADAFARATAVFGPDLDLRSSSALRKLLELGALEDALLWMRLDDVYENGFVASATGSALDLLGTDLGLARGLLAATGQATFSLTAQAPVGRRVVLPPGTLVETGGDAPVRFRLDGQLTLVRHDPADGTEKADAGVTAVLPGPAGNIAAKTLVRLNATFAARHLNLDPALVQVTNPQPFTGGEQTEDDAVYRRRLFGLPRTVWTVDAVRAAVLARDGVRDAIVDDPYGGLDRDTRVFGSLCFGAAAFGRPRDPLSPYFFDIVVAPQPGVLWESEGDVRGLSDDILDALAPIRPVSIFPNLLLADTVGVAVRATLVLQPGASADGVLAAARAAVGAYVDALRLGDDVLFSRVEAALVDTPGVRDVTGLHLRRCPPRYGAVVFGPPATFGDPADLSGIEQPCGANLAIAPREVAVLGLDSPLWDLEVTAR